ncbi:MGA_1079 family surface serine endopeptidase [Mycoplasma sp. 5370]
MRKKISKILLISIPVAFLVSCSQEQTESFNFLDDLDFQNLKKQIETNLKDNQKLFSSKEFKINLSENIKIYKELKKIVSEKEIKDDELVKSNSAKITKFLNSSTFNFDSLNIDFKNLLTKLNESIKLAKEKNSKKFLFLQEEIKLIFDKNKNPLFSSLEKNIINSVETNFDSFSNIEFKMELENNLMLFNKNKEKKLILNKYNLENEPKLQEEINNVNNFLNKSSYDFSIFNNQFLNLNNKVKEELTLKENLLSSNLENFKILVFNLEQNGELDSHLVSFLKTNYKTLFEKRQNESDFLSEISEINRKIKEINHFKEEYNNVFSEDINMKIETYLSLKNSNFASLNDLESLKNTINSLNEEISNFIISNNHRNEELNNKINNLISKINENTKLTEKEKQELIASTNKIASNFQFENLEINFENKINNFSQEQLKLIELIDSNLQITTSLKSYLKIIAYSKTTISDFNNFKQKTESFFTLLTNLKQEFTKINDAIDKKEIDSEKLLNFFLNEKARNFSKIYNNESNILEDFLIQNFDDIKNKINDFYNSLKDFNVENIITSGVFADNLNNLLLQQVSSHNTVSLAKDPNGYDVERYLHSASINLNNYRVFINEGDDETFDFDVTNLELKEENKNILVLTLDVFLKSNRKIKTTITKEITFSKDVMPFINKIVLNNLDQFYEVDYEALSKLSYSEFNQIKDKKTFFKPRIKGIENFFSFDIPEFDTFKENRLYFTFNVLFNKQIIKSKVIPTLNPVDFLNGDDTQEQKDAKDFAEIQKILKGTKEYFWSLLKFKPNLFYTHSQFLAQDAKKAMSEIYDLPKFGKYEIFVKDVNNIDNYNGSADLILWYKINGTEAPIQALGDLYSHPIKMINFKLQDLEDIKPKTGKNLTEADFEGFDAIDENDANILKQLNEANIDQVKVNGQINDSGNPSNYFGIINAKDFVEQQQFYKASYLFKIVNGNNNKAVNMDNKVYVPFGTGNYDKDLTLFAINDSDLSRIRNKYFIYYYDFNLVGKRGLSFKIGFIEKEHQNKRFSTKQTFTLINLVNDYQQLHYPEIMMNNLTFDDLQINKEKLAENTISYFQGHKDQLTKILGIKNTNGFITYKNYELPVSEINVNKIQAIDETSAYVRFSLTKFGVEDPVYVKPWNKNANSWYKITGFKAESINNKRTEPSWDSSRDTDSLRTIYNSATEIHRERTLELYWKDALWKVDKETNILSWTLQHKILDPLFKNIYTSNRKLNLTFNGGAISRTDSGFSVSDNPAFNIEFDYDQIKENKITNVEKTVEKGGNSFIFNIQVKFLENGDIIFNVWPKNPENRITIDPREAAKSVVSEFDDYKFLFAPGAATLRVKYDSTQQTEDFGWNTNAFDYSKVEPNTFSQPTIFYNKPEYLYDHNVYNPNSNVPFKLHEGYTMRLETIRLKEAGEHSELVRNVIGRAIAYSPGGAIATASMIGKVNNDPNDGRFYVLTNHHAESSSIHDFSLISGDNLFFKSSDKTISAPFLQVQTYASRGRYGWTDYTSTKGNESTTIWIGIQQYNLNGDPLKNTGKTPERLDASIIIVDINPGIARAREEGKFDLALYLENWFKLANSTIDNTWRLNDFNSPVVKEIASIGYPRGNQNAILDHRPVANYWSGWKWGTIIANENGYSPFYSGAGASGTGRFNGDNSLASLWNSGVGFQYSISWNYDGQDYNYFGVNWNGEHPFELKNKHSFASQIIRANAVNPNKYDLPWFMKEIKEK